MRTLRKTLIITAILIAAVNVMTLIAQLPNLVVIHKVYAHVMAKPQSSAQGIAPAETTVAVERTTSR